MFGQIRRLWSECINQCIAMSPFQLSKLWHIRSICSDPSGVSEHSAVPSSYGVPSRTPFTIEMVRSRDLRR